MTRKSHTTEAEQAVLTAEESLLLQWARKDAGNRSNPWPGMPISNLPLEMRDVLHSMRERGWVHIQDVVKPSKVKAGETMTYSYVVPSVLKGALHPELDAREA